jgi:hypothetical protein
MFSGGIGSWAAAKWVVDQYGSDDLILLFTDVKGNNESVHVGEDEDTYRFIHDAARNLGGRFIYLNAGKDIWEVFKESRYLGNSRLAKCSHELKQKPARNWLNENCLPGETMIYLGIDWTEIHRLPAIVRNYLPFEVQAPLTEKPYYSKEQLFEMAEQAGLQLPRLYSLGFAHNNCGGGCVRAGQGQFKHLLDVMPERFAEWEKQEQLMQQHLNRDVTILSEVKDGVKKPLPLIELRRRAEQQPSLIDEYDIGGCSCFTDDETVNNL